MLSLVGKELTELVARRGTYWGRVINGLLLFAVFFIWEISRRVTAGESVGFGGGDRIFFGIVWAQWVMLLLLVPLATGGIARERERGSWSLLILTRLTPGEIVGQKYLAGLIPALMSVLLLLPMGALCYSVGGLERSDVMWSILVIGLAVCQIGALGMLCSVLCRTSLGAVMLTLLLSAGINFVPSSAVSTFRLLGELQGGDGNPGQGSLGVLASAVILLAGAWCCLNRVSLPAGRTVLRRVLRVADICVERCMPGAKQFGDALSARCLSRRPLAWRELTRRSLCRWSHLMWLTLPALAGIVAFSVWISSHPTWTPQQAMPVLMAVLWVGTLVFVTLEAANMVVREREDQTLDVLLTTPISAAEIVLQKAVALQRLAWMCRVVLMAGAVASVLLRSELVAWIYLPLTLIAALLYPPLAYWLGFLVGARSRSRVGATCAAVAAGGGILIFGMLMLFINEVFVVLSPAFAVAINERGLASSGLNVILFVTLFHVGAMIGAGIVLRHLALWFANRWIGRPVHSLWINPEAPPAPSTVEDPY